MARGVVYSTDPDDTACFIISGMNAHVHRMFKICHANAMTGALMRGEQLLQLERYPILEPDESMYDSPPTTVWFASPAQAGSGGSRTEQGIHSWIVRGIPIWLTNQMFVNAISKGLDVLNDSGFPRMIGFFN